MAIQKSEREEYLLQAWKEVAAEAFEAKEELSHWEQFKRVYSASAWGKDTRSWPRACRLLVWRQGDLTDSVRVLCEAGRGAAANAVLRICYEHLIHLLLIGYQHGEIEPKLMTRFDRSAFRSKSRSGIKPTKEHLARRFIAFGEFHEFARLTERFEDKAQWTLDSQRQGVSVAEANRMYRSRARKVERIDWYYGFSRRAAAWFPFDNIDAIREHLWPADGCKPPLFPEKILSKEVWLDSHRICYENTTDFIHPSAKGHNATSRDYMTRIADADDTPYPDALTLNIARLLFGVATGAFAHTHGLLRAWNRVYHPLHERRRMNGGS
jgi:hypothetical protein